MACARLLEVERPQALTSHALFHTHDIDEARERVAKIFCPHELRLVHAGEAVESRMSHVPLGAVSLNRLAYGAAVQIDSARLEDFYLVQMPISGVSEVVCGKDMVQTHPGRASVVTPTLPLQICAGKDFDQVIIKIGRALLERHCAQHLGHDLAHPIEFQLGMELESSQVQSWCRLVQWLVHEADYGGGVLGSRMVRGNFEQMIIGALLFCQPNNYTDELQRPASPIAPYYVRRAEEYMHTHAEDPISVIELAEHTGVSTRALYAGFQSFRGVSPMAFLKSVRLERVRKDLLTASPCRVTVSDVATRWGFSHFGHFAAGYRQKFGETPSQTLRRSL